MIKSVFEVLRVEEYDAQMKAARPREIKTAGCARDECVFVLNISAQSASHFYLVLSNFPSFRLPPSLCKGMAPLSPPRRSHAAYPSSFLSASNLRFYWCFFFFSQLNFFFFHSPCLSLYLLMFLFSFHLTSSVQKPAESNAAAADTVEVNTQSYCT